GVRHNSLRRPDGRWTWRYDLFGPWPERNDDDEHWSDFTTLWADVAQIKMPAMLVRGALSKYVTDDDEAEMVRLIGSLRVEHVDGAGHAVQSDQPLQLAELID
ncbi:alpha/beta hydrolase, partial [Arthrospira platensis SPKY2]